MIECYHLDIRVWIVELECDVCHYDERKEYTNTQYETYEKVKDDPSFNTEFQRVDDNVMCGRCWVRYNGQMPEENEE